MHLSIVVPFSNAEKETTIWAFEERSIDFRRDSYQAARCTTAFAAVELRHYLSRTLSEAIITFSAQPPEANFFIELRMLNYTSKQESFSLEPFTHSLLITGQGRTGLLYGVYEFLRLQGWRWYAPGQTGEIAPAIRDRLILPQTRVTWSPSMFLGRGMDLEYASEESAELLLWMTRNRLNVSSLRPVTAPLAHKLGMRLKIGGHFLETILHPERVLSSGQTLWEEHPEWYGLPADGIRQKEKALRTQFCVSQPELIRFLGESVLELVTGEWKAADRVDIWGFDTWGSPCTCKGCQQIGNGTDQILFLLAALRGILQQALWEGRLDHDIQLTMCAYEGTCTLEAPTRPIPQTLLDAGDGGIFYPIRRCYAHDFTDASCAQNKFYAEKLHAWFSLKPTLPLTIGEYFNVSRFEDLPLLFTTRLVNDFRDYYKAGIRGITYMHVPLVNWGMRTLTQILYAQLAWDIQTDVSALLLEYFGCWYGPYASQMQTVYALVEEAWRFSAEWRAWGPQSVLTQLQAWDGAIPGKPLSVPAHFETPAGAVASGRHSLALLQEAMDLLDAVRADERIVSAQMASTDTRLAVNPIEARQLEPESLYETRLAEDRRSLIYGKDMLKLMTGLVAYHDALYRGDAPEAETVWQQIEQVAESLDSYYVPISCEWPGPGLLSKDGLTRSQLRALLRRCRKQRMLLHS